MPKAGFIDDTHEYFNRFSSDCGTCIHFKELTYSCSAFKRIPLPILEGEQKHREVIKGQRGTTVYKKR